MTVAARVTGAEPFDVFGDRFTPLVTGGSVGRRGWASGWGVGVGVGVGCWVGRRGWASGWASGSGVGSGVGRWASGSASGSASALDRGGGAWAWASGRGRGRRAWGVGVGVGVGAAAQRVVGREDVDAAVAVAVVRAGDSAVHRGAGERGDLGRAVRLGWALSNECEGPRDVRRGQDVPVVDLVEAEQVGRSERRRPGRRDPRGRWSKLSPQAVGPRLSRGRGDGCCSSRRPRAPRGSWRGWRSSTAPGP